MGIALLLGCLVVWGRISEAGRGVGGTGTGSSTSSISTEGTAGFAFTDQDLRTALDRLLADVNPELASNGYFGPFATDKLRWLNREHRAGRVHIVFFRDTTDYSLPPDVVMVSMVQGPKATIFVSKPRLASDLLNTGSLHPPFSARQRNDFAIALVHETLHVQNPDADPANAAEHAQEELRVWRDVTLNMVRPIRRSGQPMHPRFVEVDDILRQCGDRLPCPPLAHVVRLLM
jgi:hypothetical protein